jgi:hypothetical protein
MTTYQEERLTSNELVVKEAENNPTSMNLIPSFAAGITKLKAINAQIIAIRPLQEQETSGITGAKNYTQDELIADTVIIAGAIHSYAHDKSDIALKALVHVKKGEVTNISGAKIISKAQAVLAEAKKVAATDLAKEGISAAELKEYENMVTYFGSIKSTPREAIIGRSVYTEEMAQLFEQAHELFKNSLDKLALQFEEKDPVFYQRYLAARNVIHRGPSGGTDKNKGTNTDGPKA